MQRTRAVRHQKKRKMRPEYRIILFGSGLIFLLVVYFAGSLIFKSEERVYTDPLLRISSLDELDDKTREAAELFLRIARDQGLNVTITETYRTQERQDYLYTQGRTRGGAVVTWTRNSRHTKRDAFDIAKDSPGHEYDDTAFFKKCADIGESIGLEAGFYWKNGQQDMPHFQMTTFGKLIYPEGYERSGKGK